MPNIIVTEKQAIAYAKANIRLDSIKKCVNKGDYFEISGFSNIYGPNLRTYRVYSNGSITRMMEVKI